MLLTNDRGGRFHCPCQTPNLIEADAVIQPEIEAYLQAHVAAGQFMGSVLVAQGDHVLHSAGYGMADLEHNVANTSHTKYRLGSIAKQFTAAAILNLQD